MPAFTTLAESNLDTVIAEYTPEPRNSSAFQSEAQLEAEFIRLLSEQGYTYLKIHTASDLKANLRIQLETLNHYTFSDSEWQSFFTDIIAKKSDGIKGKIRKIQDRNETTQALIQDNGMTKNITLIDKKNIHNNSLQVINQYQASTKDGAIHPNRYDVTILVNGFPMIHVELKRRGIPIREAFTQIDRYIRDSFWSGDGLFEYVQIFVISNGTETKYYSATTRANAVKDFETGKHTHDKASSSFEFTSFWADAKNQNIPDLVDFTRTFFARHTILNVITKYCVFTSRDELLVMRPYQITAAERIINRIEIAHNYKKYGDISAGGYIWHTTGSGKTLTSFKTAVLATGLGYIDKVLFVVDRKDLDAQTMREYNRFEKNAANSNTSTAVLTRQLGDSKSRIIITTIQKLSAFIKTHKTHDVYNKQVVIIFDECHRSQFGGMHQAISRHFRKHYIFGFTGTPIFEDENTKPDDLTTQRLFGSEIHAYTILNAIIDKNVLPFKVDYIRTMHKKDDIIDEKVRDIDREGAYLYRPRISLIVRYILEHFEQKTSKRRFNSILAVSSINAAMMYYDEFRRTEEAKNLKIAVIYSYAPDKEQAGGIIEEENPEDTSGLDVSQREFLEGAIQDYNAVFSTNYDASGEKFQNYYRDVSFRMKNRELDLLIVVSMFLTGFDAPALNTLWVDKNLRMHGLIQTFSRTNRILNSIKTFGNVVCFRELQERVNEAIARFSNNLAGELAVIRKFDDYYGGYVSSQGIRMPGYTDMIRELTMKFPLSEPQIIGEESQREFIVLFGAVLRMKNLLNAFDEFAGMEILSERDYQDYTSRYLDLRDEWKRRIDSGEIADISGDLVFELELISQVEINIDYIMLLAGKYQESHCVDKEILTTIQKAVNASPELRSKRQLIETFLAGITEAEDVIDAWIRHVAEQKEKDLAALINEEDLKPEEFRKYIDEMFRKGRLRTSGESVKNFMPPFSIFDPLREEKKRNIINKLQTFFEKYRGA